MFITEILRSTLNSISNWNEIFHLQICPSMHYTIVHPRQILVINWEPINTRYLKLGNILMRCEKVVKCSFTLISYYPSGYYYNTS